MEQPHIEAALKSILLCHDIKITKDDKQQKFNVQREEDNMLLKFCQRFNYKFE